MASPFWSRRGEPPPERKRTIVGAVWRYIWPRLTGLVLVLLIATFAAIVVFPYMVVTVPSGHVGVLWKRFWGGTVLDPKQLKGEGIHIILPWDRLFIYDLRIRSINTSYNAISSDGVNLTATVNIRFRLRRKYLPELHQVIGPSYVQLLGPEVASRMREIISQYTAEQVYSTKRLEI